MSEAAKEHLRNALAQLRIEAYRIEMHGHQAPTPLAHMTIAEELHRIDSALGPRGQSMFAPIAEAIRTAYVEMVLALEDLEKEPRP